MPTRGGYGWDAANQCAQQLVFACMFPVASYDIEVDHRCASASRWVVLPADGRVLPDICVQLAGSFDAVPPLFGLEKKDTVHVACCMICARSQRQPHFQRPPHLYSAEDLRHTTPQQT